MSQNSTSTSSHPPWFCHACQTRFIHPLDPQDPECTNCHSSFVEELELHDSHHPLNLWSPSNFNHFNNSIPDDSPPIPSTRQRYEQQQRQNAHPNIRQPNPQIPNYMDPIIEFLASTYPNPSHNHSPSSSSPPPPPRTRSNPPSLSSMGDFFTSHYSPPTFTNPTLFPNQSTETSEHLNNQQSNTQADSTASSGSRPPLQGIYTFAFSSQPSTPIPPDPDTTRDRPAHHAPSGDQPSQPDDGRLPNDERFPSATAGSLPQQPLHGILSLLQSAFGLNQGNNNSTTTQNDRRPASNPSNPQPTHETSRDQTSTSSTPGGDWPGVNEDRTRPDSPRRQSRPTPRSPRVNVEESHPLRQFINILNSLNQSDGSISRSGVNGFVFNGGAGFGFTTQFDMDQNAPLGQNLGDYVTSDSTMQDILNQLINMTGANGAHNPTPASESTIKSLKRFKFDTNTTGNEEPIECAICKDTFTAGDDCTELPCKHYFHDEDCIQPWLKQNGSCPVCRYSLVNNNCNSDSDPRATRDTDNTEDESNEPRTRMGDERDSMNRSSSHNSPPSEHPQPSQSSNWTDDWEAYQLEPQFDFD